MKKVLITGVNSYIGNNLRNWLLNREKHGVYSVDLISLKDNSWKEKNFSNYDTVVHVAGIAHVSKDNNMKNKYYQINRDLTIETARKAKNEGVNQFIFLSSIIVYGESVRKSGIVNRETTPAPHDFYGDSKLQAEQGISPLGDEDFKVAIIRPPMIYGKDSKGNYPKLAVAAQKLPIFPDFDNKRSMLHIDNLCEFIRLIIVHEDRGLFFPQNQEYVKTSEMVKLIAEAHGKNIKLVSWFNPILQLLRNKINIFNKVFGDLVYDKEMSSYISDYQVRNMRESIQLTEGGNK
ncbi:UDP-glucose 4-epimerase [Lentibacillus persicus]|uniref:UDP-glucose 4-epimerase n=1 Tax=Lentibacillus persicus TaxID=640948 RepID=A0A1I1VY96_9BACI|nr:NAD-dependent epimerase/dehydratase family protein [Lentibacillus persicus]SFD87038.1 UDP-glucose 4-epimerase [Lentibacillus persicus]